MHVRTSFGSSATLTRKKQISKLTISRNSISGGLTRIKRKLFAQNKIEKNPPMVALVSTAILLTDNQSPSHARCNLRSRRRSRRLRAVVEPDRRQITRRVRRNVSRCIPSERSRRELPAHDGVLQESIWP